MTLASASPNRPTRRPPAAISSPSIPLSRPSRPPPQPTPHLGSKSTSASLNNRAPKFPPPRRSARPAIKLPKGFSINTGAADGKSACADVEARLGTPKEAQCPETSKVGTVTLNSSALPGPIPGFVYLLEPKAGDRYRILLSANGFATHVKVVGSVTPDPATGQLTTSFPNLPESPFTDFNIHYFGSERGLLATPTQCGTYPVESSFTPWDSALPEQTSTQLFTLSSGPGGAPCPGSSRPFNPAFQASSVNSTAAAHSPFSLEVTRNDGEQNLSSIDVTTPPGFSATLKGIPYCPDVALAAAAAPSYSGLQQQSNPSCPPASQIGTATVGAGAGSHPVYLPGQVYLAGPYKGAPLSLAVITPAVSGPYDLGSVVVRAAINVNPETAQITAVSDSLPQIFEGIPLRLRSVLVNLNRPNFTLNPTNCDPFAVNTQVFGSEGAVASPSEHFQAANCRTLPFAPKLNLKLTGGVHRRGHPAIQATLQTNPGEANPSSVSVTLPSGELLDNAHIGTVCTKPQFAQNACPAGSLVGDAEVATPLLDQPLKGPVYLRSSSHGLPDLAIDSAGPDSDHGDRSGQLGTMPGSARPFRRSPTCRSAASPSTSSAATRVSSKTVKPSVVPTRRRRFRWRARTAGPALSVPNSRSPVARAAKLAEHTEHTTNGGPSDDLVSW